MDSCTLTMPGWQPSCFASLVAFTLAMLNRFCPNPCSSPLIDTLQPAREYDFIIVGAGTAGSVLANRLTECHNWTVLVLEAGGPPQEISTIPFLAEQLHNTHDDWRDKTAPPKHGQAYCLAMNNHQCLYHEGKVVGGASVINSMQYVRGNKKNYDEWEAAGNTGWGYHHVLKYFLKSEDNRSPSHLRTPFHSSGGYLAVESASHVSPLGHAFLRAGEHLRYKVHDINGEHQEGFQVLESTTKKGLRWSTSKAYLESAQKRPNLDLSMYSFVTQVHFEDGHSGPTARTVSFTKGNRKHSVRARKEIILSAGSVHSPQLLMLSGIGPKKHLEDLGIKVVQDLPVGQGLQDHASGGELTFKVRGNVTIKPQVLDTPDVLAEYLSSGRGPLSSSGVEANAFVSSKYAEQSYPDIEFLFLAKSIFNNGLPSVVAEYNLRPGLFNHTKYEKLDVNGSYFSIQVIPIRPKSRGQIMLRSKNPHDHPIINPNYFSNRNDLKVLVDGYQLALKLVDTPPFKEYGATPLRLHFPGCEGLRLYSDEYFECYVRHFTRTGNDITSTVRMGVGRNAVVDPRLKVIGVKGLRVIDSSVLPSIVSGDTSAATIMVAEKGADIIKEDWNYSGHCVERTDRCQENEGYPRHCIDRLRSLPLNACKP